MGVVAVAGTATSIRTPTATADSARALRIHAEDWARNVDLGRTAVAVLQRAVAAPLNTSAIPAAPANASPIAPTRTAVEMVAAESAGRVAAAAPVTAASASSTPATENNAALMAAVGSAAPVARARNARADSA